MYRFAVLATASLLLACADQTPRAMTPTTTTGPYNTGTTATPGLSAGHAAAATESGGAPVGDVAPRLSAPVSPGH